MATTTLFFVFLFPWDWLPSFFCRGLFKCFTVTHYSRADGGRGEEGVQGITKLQSFQEASLDLKLVETYE